MFILWNDISTVCCAKTRITRLKQTVWIDKNVHTRTLFISVGKQIAQRCFCANNTVCSRKNTTFTTGFAASGLVQFGEVSPYIFLATNFFLIFLLFIKPERGQLWVDICWKHGKIFLTYYLALSSKFLNVSDFTHICMYSYTGWQNKNLEINVCIE